MRWRFRSHVLLAVSLSLPLLLPAVSRAEDTTPQQPSPPSSRPPLITPAPPPAGGGSPSPTTPSPTVSAAPPIGSAHDAQDTKSGPRANGELAPPTSQVFSEDWWGHARPIIEFHGFFRTRAELFNNFYLGRHNSSLNGNDPQYLWPVPLDQSYTSLSTGIAGNGGGTSNTSVSICGPNPNAYNLCYDKTESGANMRLRLDPEIDISDNLRIVTEVDLLDNVVLGSTPDSYATQPAAGQSAAINNAFHSSVNLPTGYTSAGVNAYAPIGFLGTTQGVPTAGVNSSTNSISVKRAWAEYMTPVGQLRFGRMPSHWGLGMVDNAGDGIDSDYQTTVDRIMFVTGLKSMDLFFGGAWDFISTGPQALPGATVAPVWDVYGGQPYNTCNLCNVNEWAAYAAHRTNPELQRLTLARNGVVVNGGLYAKYRSQYIDVLEGTTPQTIDSGQNGMTAGITNNGLEPRRAWSFTPDLWLQILWNKLRFEAEAAMIWGEIGFLANANQDINNQIDIREFGLATQTEYRALEDKLQLEFDFGYASGDPWGYNTTTVNGISGQQQGAIQPPITGVQGQYNTYGPLSTFAFHPDYRVDLIFFRNILTRVEGAYYFKPTVNYDFIRHVGGEKLGGGISGIWSRASQFVQTPGHKSDLGIELDAQLYYQSKDGSLNDDPSKIGGFYTMLQYGVFFPLGGLDYLGTTAFDAPLSAAQIVRLYLGVVF
jgi:uncharacterized protein (TIGR04551 family)